ncbi:MAG: ParB N-terminal domain-containing protein [Bacteroidales bacterium]|nr:ParB N-terminal domain-containing protein [Bacteroidales bacterium]
MKQNLEFEYVEAKKLVPYVRNAKTHSETQIKKIMGSITEFGFIAPIIIDKDNNVLAGHGRLLAADRLGLEKVPCVREDHLTETQRKAYILADNRIGELAGWDDELLKVELEELKVDDFDLDILGFENFNFNIPTVLSDLEEGAFLEKFEKESEIFSITFHFPKEKETELLQKLKEIGKDEVVKEIMIFLGVN